jgi:hypothetical protein
MVAGAAIGTVGSMYAGSQAKKGAQSAAQTSADAQMAGLEYLKESERLPMYYRDQALGLLAGEYGLPAYQAPAQDQPQSQSQNLVPAVSNAITSKYRGRQAQAQAPSQPAVTGEPVEAAPSEPMPSVVDLAKGSPIYDAILSSRGAGEEAILRGASATGGLRGGASVSDLVDYNTQLENQALLTSYQNIMGGLSNLAGAQGYAPQIAQQYSNIGATQGAGIAAGAQIDQNTYGSIASGLGNMATAYFNRPQKTVETPVTEYV